METDTQTQRATTTESFLLRDLVGNLLHMFKSKVTDRDMLRKVSRFTLQVRLSFSQTVQNRSQSLLFYSWLFTRSLQVLMFSCGSTGSFVGAICPRLFFDMITSEREEGGGGGCPSKWLTSYLWCPSVIQVPRSITGGLSIHWKSSCLNL